MNSEHKNRKYWGWGKSDVQLPKERLENTLQLLSMGLGIKLTEAMTPPEPEAVSLALPKTEPDGAVGNFCSTDHFQRLYHSYGQSFRDVWRSIHGIFPRPPDMVAFPGSESDIQALMQFAKRKNLGIIIYGGGTSVVGGVELPENSGKDGFISMDMGRMDKILSIDENSLTVTVQAGILGPALERALKEKGLVLRHYPQSFEFSSVGGWVATRAGGHYATVFTQIDHFVQQIRLINSTGIIQARKLPNSGAGPNENRYFCGSEGAFGVISEVTLKVQKIPKFKKSVTVRFKSFTDGVAACRALAQSQLYPTNARLIDPLEALGNGLGDGASTILILGYESPVAEVDSLLEAALSICRDHHGEYVLKEGKTRDPKADNWKKSFLSAPYLRDELILRGLVVETFETCTTWSNFETLHREIKSKVQQAILDHCGAGMITCRFTHLYPDGPAPYYTVIAQGSPGKQLEQWESIKRVASEVIVSHGGTITHHHAVGRDHQLYFEREQDAEFQKLLRAMKDHFDPDGLFNEGVLIAKD